MYITHSRANYCVCTQGSERMIIHVCTQVPESLAVRLAQDGIHDMTTLITRTLGETRCTTRRRQNDIRCTACKYMYYKYTPTRTHAYYCVCAQGPRWGSNPSALQNNSPKVYRKTFCRCARCVTHRFQNQRLMGLMKRIHQINAEMRRKSNVSKFWRHCCHARTRKEN